MTSITLTAVIVAHPLAIPFSFIGMTGVFLHRQDNRFRKLLPDGHH
jgi:hypothetical protein